MRETCSLKHVAEDNGTFVECMFVKMKNLVMTARSQLNEKIG